MVKYCYFDGKILPENKAGINLRDLGVLRGYGVFEVLRTYNRKPFLINEHLKRFRNSAKNLRLKSPLSGSQIIDIVRKLILKNDVKEATIRLVLTGGVSSDGILLDGMPTIYILIEPLHIFPRWTYEKGVKVMTCEFQREFPHVKVNNYLTAIRMQCHQKRNKAFEIIYKYGNRVLEASTSNVFIVKKGRISTPKNDVLIGTTRNFVIELAKKNRLKVEERDVKFKEMLNADETFLTATNKAIIPVVRVDQKKIGTGKVGETTKLLMEKYSEFVSKY